MDAGDTFDVVTADVTPPKRDPRRTVVAGLLIGTLALAGGLLVLGGGSDGDDERVRPPDTSTPSTTGDIDDPDTVLELMPAGPLDGKDSWRLPVLVVPQSDVVDGQSVVALGRGFAPFERVGVVMCASEAATEGVGACSLGTSNSLYEYVTYANADEQGDVRSPLRLRQSIETPATGPIDCASAPERCLVAIGAVNDYDRSGGSFVNFDGAPEFEQPGMLVEPVGPYISAQVVRIGAAGLIPTRDVELAQCLGDVCLLLHRGQVGADGVFSASGAVEPVLTSPDGGPLPCGTSCVLRVQGTGLRGASAAPMPADIPIAFVDDGQAPPPAAPPPSTETTVTPPPEVTETPTTSLAIDTMPPLSSTTTEAPSASSTSPPSVEPLPLLSTTVPGLSDEPATTRPEPLDQLESLVASSELVLAGSVVAVRPPDGPDPIDSPALPVVLVDVEPSRMLIGAWTEPIVLSWEGSPAPAVGDELLLFLVPEDPTSGELYGSTYQTQNVLTISDGIVSGGLEGDPVLAALRGLTLDEVAERIAE